ncbi:hypothetical protein QBC36DRAFT_329378 [Triangularia setosa]|uniref:Uncharacterized protein n=1 Tax=Triangularia setosa TaxID=2587417 RepID=A0AAN7A5T9_9PEZI|nr:hypothetical protein QBC36DRAFT_329378 [Podospora setosa]
MDKDWLVGLFFLLRYLHIDVIFWSCAATKKGQGLAGMFFKSLFSCTSLMSAFLVYGFFQEVLLSLF